MKPSVPFRWPGSSLLHLNSQEQEDKFDIYPAFHLLTSGFVLAKRLERANKIIWPEPNRCKRSANVANKERVW